MTPRLAATLTLKKVLSENEPFDTQNPLIRALDPKLQGLARLYCFGVLKHYYQLSFFSRQLLSKPFKDKDSDLFALLLIALFELSQNRTQNHAVVHESVESVKKLGKTWAKGVINACLRSFIEKKTALEALCANNQEASLNCPKWLCQKLKAQWPNDWERILLGNVEHPPMSLRVNAQKSTRESYLEKLKVAGLNASPLPWCSHGLLLEKPQDVYQLPDFAEGGVSVQNHSAQLLATLLPLAPNARVLDACAAPGGKAALLLETEPSIQLDAVEINPSRVVKLQSTLSRLNLKAQIFQVDAQDTHSYWQNKPYDIIILDAPCTGSGVMRKHPEIKIRLNSKRIEEAVNQQAALLDRLWPLLKVDGILVYATCSILQEENVFQMKQFMDNHVDARELTIKEPWGIQQTIGRQILPNETMDGFYYATLVKMPV